MAVQNSVAVRNARLDSFESTIGTSPKLQLRTGAQPASCASAATGTLLCEIALPSDWMGAADNGVKAKLGTWQGTGLAAAGAGTAAAHYRIVDTAGTTCHEQGSVSGTGGGGDITLDNVSIAENQTVTIATYQKTAPHA